MSASSAPARVSAKPGASTVRWLLIGWLVAGTFDITYAIVFSYLRSGVAPSRIFKSVASGVLGRAAYDGGINAAALGLALHYLNALIITTIFFVVARSQPGLAKRPLLIGILYGAVVYLVMNYVVIPLSAIGAIGYPPPAVWISGVLVHMFLIGVPIVLAARHAYLDEGVVTTRN